MKMNLLKQSIHLIIRPSPPLVFNSSKPASLDLTGNLMDSKTIFMNLNSRQTNQRLWFKVKIYSPDLLSFSSVPPLIYTIDNFTYNIASSHKLPFKFLLKHSCSKTGHFSLLSMNICHNLCQQMLSFSIKYLYFGHSPCFHL